MLYLVGFMGSGKSVVSKRLSNISGCKLIDTDNYIEDKYDRMINDIFANSGEEAFRNMETEALREISSKGRMIVSCGGGIVIKKENVDIMKKSGKIVYLKATPQTVFERVKHSSNRPILNGNMNVEFIKNLMDKRSDYYDGAADYIVDTDGKSIEDIAGEILIFANNYDII